MKHVLNDLKIHWLRRILSTSAGTIQVVAAVRVMLCSSSVILETHLVCYFYVATEKSLQNIDTLLETNPILAGAPKILTIFEAKSWPYHTISVLIRNQQTQKNFCLSQKNIQMRKKETPEY